MKEWAGTLCRKRGRGRRQSCLSIPVAGLLLGALIANTAAVPAALAQDDPLALSNDQAVEYAPVEYLGTAELPPAVGQPDFAVYIPETGHSLDGVFLDYWRATVGDATFGPPISESFAAPDGF